MRKFYLIIMLISFSFLKTAAQKIAYSKQNFITSYTDAMQLVADVSGYHHLITFVAGEKPEVHIYDSDLMLLEEQIVQVKLKENSDLSVVKFKDFYYLYLHENNSFFHQVWRINGKGEILNQSARLQTFISRELEKTAASLQLINIEDKLFVVSHTYYDAIEKVATTVSELDRDLNAVHVRRVFYNFQRGSLLQQVMLIKNNLFVLKTSPVSYDENSLDILNVDLNTGHSLTNSFRSGVHIYSSPGFTFNPVDSNVLVYSLVREPLSANRSERTVFISMLDYSLHEKLPVKLLKSQFRSNTSSNYIFVKGSVPMWLNVNVTSRPAKRGRRRGIFDIDNETSSNVSLSSARNGNFGSSPNSYFSAPSLRLSMFDSNLKLIRDSVLVNENFEKVKARPHAQFRLKNKSCLLLIQNLSSRSRGLLMIEPNDDGSFLRKDIRVFDRNEYMLTHLQSIRDDYFILPYTYKREIGLVKISFP